MKEKISFMIMFVLVLPSVLAVENSTLSVNVSQPSSGIEYDNYLSKQPVQNRLITVMQHYWFLVLVTIATVVAIVVLVLKHSNDSGWKSIKKKYSR